MGVDRCEMRIEIDSGSQRRRGNNCVAVRDLMDRKVPSNVERWAFVRRMQNAPEMADRLMYTSHLSTKRVAVNEV